MGRLEAFGAVLSSSKTALEATLGPLQFYKNFRISLSTYVHTQKVACWDYIESTLNLYFGMTSFFLFL